MRRRSGFTLIELIVVIAIMFVLMALVVAVVRRSSTNDTTEGASRVVGWLKYAQMRASYDKRPSGVRFNTSGGAHVQLGQYIQQPDEWVQPFFSIDCTPVIGANTVTVTTYADISGGNGPTSNQSTWPIQPNDYFEVTIFGGDIIGQIKSMSMVQVGTKWQSQIVVTLWPPDAPVAAGSNWNLVGNSSWRVVRQPFVMIGSDTLSLPGDVRFDSSIQPPQAPLPMQGTNVDILFGPDGRLIGRTAPVYLWIVDTSKNPSASYLVYINAQTGLIGIQSVAPGPDPYAFTRDGKTSGF